MRVGRCDRPGWAASSLAASCRQFRSRCRITTKRQPCSVI